MDSGSSRNFQNQSEQSGSGLLRFRSAPSTLLSNFGGQEQGAIGDDSPAMGFRELDGKSAAKVKGAANSGGGYPNSSTLARSYSGLPPHYPKADTASSGVDRDGSYGLMMASLGINQNEAARTLKTVDYSSLGRQSSSPAGFFEDLSSHNGNYPSMKGYNPTNQMGANNGGEESSPRQRPQLSFSSRISPSMTMLSSDIDLEHVSPSSPESPSLVGVYGGAGFPYGGASWNEPHFGDTASIAHHHRQNGGEIGVHGLSRHLSLPNKAGASGEMDTFLRFQDSVPCKIRAKRGCATHPRSIAERVRRTRISERMRKLQDLVPNMDKQTNTADMLDLAVDYIKDLQAQYKACSLNT
ncbi:unnamed protein product [Linum tenue]|uniref:BHLH domain-containing protein n=1 Tax=Linum tenue TaxID=586396 RepID=A0AAV0MKQ7_9ROSI|nr:unnamed protein product [Linum tenue]